MPLSLDTLAMNAIAAMVGKWQTNQMTADAALKWIENYITQLRKLEWERDHK